MKGNLILNIRRVCTGDEEHTSGLHSMRLYLSASRHGTHPIRACSRSIVAQANSCIAVEQLFCFVGMEGNNDAVDFQAVSLLSDSYSTSPVIQTCRMPVAGFLGGDPFSTTLEFGKGAIEHADVIATWRPTEMESDAEHGRSRDAFGFVVPEEFLRTYKQFHRTLWDVPADVMSRIDDLLDEGLNVHPPRKESWKRELKAGMPMVHRGEVWLVSSGIKRRLLAERESYVAVCKRAETEESPSAEEIKLDLHRTYAGHPVFSSKSGQEILNRVLTRYALRNPVLGYCQGLNFICALFLMFMDEEAAFWALAALCEEMCPMYYSKDMNGAQVDTNVLDDLIQSKLKNLHGHFKKLNVELSLVSMGWLITLFADVLPAETTVRVWDFLFCDGSPRSVFQFRVALAVLKLLEPMMTCQTSFEAVMEKFKSMLASVWNSEQLLYIAFTRIGRMDTDLIERRRAYHFMRISDARSTRVRGRAVGSPADSEAQMQDIQSASNKEWSNMLKSKFAQSMQTVKGGWSSALQTMDKLSNDWKRSSTGSPSSRSSQKAVAPVQSPGIIRQSKPRLSMAQRPKLHIKDDSEGIEVTEIARPVLPAVSAQQDGQYDDDTSSSIPDGQETILVEASLRDIQHGRRRGSSVSAADFADALFGDSKDDSSHPTANAKSNEDMIDFADDQACRGDEEATSHKGTVSTEQLIDWD